MFFSISLKSVPLEWAKDYVSFAFHPNFLETFWTGWTTMAFDYSHHNSEPPWCRIQLKASSFIEIKMQKG